MRVCLTGGLAARHSNRCGNYSEKHRRRSVLFSFRFTRVLVWYFFSFVRIHRFSGFHHHHFDDVCQRLAAVRTGAKREPFGAQWSADRHPRHLTCVLSDAGRSTGCSCILWRKRRRRWRPLERRAAKRNPPSELGPFAHDALSASPHHRLVVCRCSCRVCAGSRLRTSRLGSWPRKAPLRCSRSKTPECALACV
jgi:hypothetical protein